VGVAHASVGPLPEDATFRLRFEIDAGEADAAAGLLHLCDAGGVEVRGEGELPPPGVAPVAAGRIELIGYFPTVAQAEVARGALRERLAVDAVVESVAAEAWEESWKQHFRPVRLGELIVAPPWDTGPAGDGCARLILEPGMAFGTGTHATTALCLRALQRWLAGRPGSGAGSSVLDVGTGSGILALAAAMLGAGRIAATDNDPVAIRVAGENALRNGLEGRVAFGTQPLEDLEAKFDLVLANILCNTLIELAGPLSARLARGGRLVLSGILVEQAAEVAAAFAPMLVAVACESEGEWMLLELRTAGG
jgi:ribosomal protein L11 methyltransferase